MSITGKEQIEGLKHGKGYIRYSYQHTDHALFHCVEHTLEVCRKFRDIWIKDNFLLSDNQIVFGRSDNEKYFVFRSNIKGTVILIHYQTGRIRVIPRSCFFQHFSLFGSSRLSEILDAGMAYGLMLRSYQVNFNQIRENKEHKLQKANSL